MSAQAGGDVRAQAGADVSAGAGAALLAVRSLSKSFGGIRAVHDVSFSLAAGEMLALIGPNGAGKTTTFNMASGQLPPDGG